MKRPALSNVVDYQCTKCRYVKRMTKKDLRKKLLIKVIRELFVVLGVAMLLLVIVAGPVSVVETATNRILTKNARVDTEELRRAAINATEKCIDERSTNSYCYGYHIYKHLSNLRYVPASYFKPISSPSDVYDYGGDCKNMAFLFVSMMKSVGFEAVMECDWEEEHCIALVPRYVDYEREPGYAVVDLTIPGFYSMDTGSDPWTYKIEGDRYG